jgi:hypothetical protein
MYPEELRTLLVVYECGSLDCRRYYSPGSGYFCALPQMMDASTEIDPSNRGRKACPEKGEEHRFMAIVGRKSPKAGDTYPFCFYCYDCKREFPMVSE